MQILEILEQHKVFLSVINFSTNLTHYFTLRVTGNKSIANVSAAFTQTDGNG